MVPIWSAAQAVAGCPRQGPRLERAVRSPLHADQGQRCWEVIKPKGGKAPPSALDRRRHPRPLGRPRSEADLCPSRRSSAARAKSATMCISVPTVVGRKGSRGPARRSSSGPAGSLGLAALGPGAPRDDRSRSLRREPVRGESGRGQALAPVAEKGGRAVRVTMGSGAGARQWVRRRFQSDDLRSGKVVAAMDKSLDRKLGAGSTLTQAAASSSWPTLGDGDIAAWDRLPRGVASGAHPSELKFRYARGILRPDAVDHAPGPGRHHADVRRSSSHAADLRGERLFDGLGRDAGRAGQ